MSGDAGAVGAAGEGVELAAAVAGAPTAAGCPFGFGEMVRTVSARSWRLQYYEVGEPAMTALGEGGWSPVGHSQRGLLKLGAGVRVGNEKSQRRKGRTEHKWRQVPDGSGTSDPLR